MTRGKNWKIDESPIKIQADDHPKINWLPTHPSKIYKESSITTEIIEKIQQEQ